VREPGRFAVRELRSARSTGLYRLRASGLRVQVRHPLLDMWVLEEIFRFRAYQPPPEILQRLRALGRPPRIADLGGHAGYFGLYMLGLFPQADITSLEPDPHNARALRGSVEANGLAGTWQVIEAAAATADGRAEFDSGFHLSRLVAAGEPPGEMLDGLRSVFPFLAGGPLLERRRVSVEVRDAFPLMAAADLLKIDIEGGEWALLADPRFPELGAAALVLEYHPADGDCAAASRMVRERLTQAGYGVVSEVRGPDAGVVWAALEG